MVRLPQPRLGRSALTLLACLAAACGLLLPLAAQADPAALRARYEQLAPQLRNSDYGQPLHIASREDGDTLHGEVHALLEHPFERVRDALRDPTNWCDILILPFNIKYCHAVRTPDGPGLLVRIGRRYDQPLDQSYRLLFDFRGVAASQDYFEARLAAPDGPVGTRDYHIVVSAIPVSQGRSFLRLNYSYGSGFAGRLAMQAYLATAGADKVGFTREQDAGNGAALIGGVRGAVERNVMRYYLAIDAFLDSLSAPRGERAERRIQSWFNATERYPRQLREMDRTTYVEMKRMEQERQQTLLQ
ncbi:hypothetical protein WG922_00965 [Ramlibacter sp. AN1015]|uniref:hypothetical protein n=1 Tax=Ramlibacter sp. AN1015 TaxID=3133428 RepID=UPI0030C1B1D8